MQYIRIKEAIAEQISSGVLLPKQKLPCERLLAQSFATTRITLREALSLLESEGVIYRENRRGWFISPMPFSLHLSSELSFIDAAKAQQREPKIALLNTQKMLANKEATRVLSLAPFASIYLVEKVYYLENSPVCFVRHYVQATLKNFLKQDLNIPLSQIYLEQYKIKCTRSLHSIHTSSLIGEMAIALKASEGAPTTVVEQISVTNEHKAIECRQQYWRHNCVRVEA